MRIRTSFLKNSQTLTYPRRYRNLHYSCTVEGIKTVTRFPIMDSNNFLVVRKVSYLWSTKWCRGVIDVRCVIPKGSLFRILFWPLSSLERKEYSFYHRYLVRRSEERVEKIQKKIWIEMFRSKYLLRLTWLARTKIRNVSLSLPTILRCVTSSHLHPKS